MIILTSVKSLNRAAAAIALLVISSVLLLAGCSSSSGVYDDDSEAGPRFVLELTPGEYYRSSTQWFIFKIPIYPQVAVWLEDENGKYMGTIYVTEKVEKSGWISAPDEGRPEALPVWSALREGELDAVSAATSKGETLYGSNLAAGLEPGDYVIMLETNRSYDYNDTFTRENAGVSGQPSLVYRAEISVGSGSDRAVFVPVGTGSTDGTDSNVHSGMEGIDTALKLFSSMTISYKE